MELLYEHKKQTERNRNKICAIFVHGMFANKKMRRQQTDNSVILLKKRLKIFDKNSKNFKKSKALKNVTKKVIKNS